MIRFSPEKDTAMRVFAPYYWLLILMDTQVPKVDLDEVIPVVVVVVVTNSSRFTRSALVLEKVAMHGVFMSSDCKSSSSNRGG